MTINNSNITIQKLQQIRLNAKTSKKSTINQKLMPPKFYSKANSKLMVQLGNFSNDCTVQKNKKNNRISLTFLLIGNNKIGVEVSYKVFNNDQQLKNIIKNHHGLWDRDERMWVLSHKDYQNMIDTVIQHCKNKQYWYSKIPSFVYDAQIDMPLDLLVKINKTIQPALIRYIDIQTNMNPQTLPFYDKLYDFQKQSLKFGIQHHGRLLLADQMGVGKTVQSLAIAFMYRQEWPLIIICPSTLRFNWLNQIMNWYGQYIKKNEVQVYTKGGTTLKDNTKILIVSYELAWKFKEIWRDFKIAIVDQAHYLKNSGCKRTDILVPELARKKRVILLTGTPAFAKPRQIYNLASIIRPDVFWNFIQFGNRYCQPSRNPWTGAWQYNGCNNSKELFYLLKNKIMLRRLKKDVLTQLPDKQRQKIVIETNKTITKQISLLMQQNGNATKKPEEIMMEIFGFRNSGVQKSDDYAKKRQTLMEAYRLSGAAKVEGVVEYIFSLLQNDVKLLIFAHHRTIIDRIQSELRAKNFKTIRIDGQVQMQERQERVNKFQNDKQIMAALLSISAAGVGLTLTASSTVVFAQLHWTPGMLIQAQDRAHRIGQKNSVNCHYLIGEGTLDNMLYNYLLKKINNVSTFVDGIEHKLQMEELSKGEKGKVSKSAVYALKKQKQQTKNQRKSFGINPIRRSIQINVELKNENEQNSQATDISSQTTTPFNKNFQKQTPSLKSRKKLQNNSCNEEFQDQEISSNLRNINKIKVLTGKHTQSMKQQSRSRNLNAYISQQLTDQSNNIQLSKQKQSSSNRQKDFKGKKENYEMNNQKYIQQENKQKQIAQYQQFQNNNDFYISPTQ